MNLKRYLIDRAGHVGAWAVCIVLVLAALAVLSVSIAAILLIAALLVGCLVSTTAYDFLKRRRYYNELVATVEALGASSQSYLAGELLAEPTFLEGVLTSSALRAAGQSMSDVVAAQRTQTGECREYVELWVHEIKTPLAAARLMTAALAAPERARLQHEIERIEALVDQTLYYARSTSLEKDFAIRELPLAACVRDAVKKHAAFIIGQGVSPVFELAEDETVFADGKWLQFVIEQIVVNSAKYEAHTVRFTSAVEYAGTPHARTVLTIADDGCGIPAGDVGSVFDKGFTGENGRRFTSSTGMGLFLCATMCERMGLGIEVASEVGVGTRIMLRFPHDRRTFDLAH